MTHPSADPSATSDRRSPAETNQANPHSTSQPTPENAADGPVPGIPNAETADSLSARALLIVAMVFVGYSLLRIPVPAVNEPHYVAKAKHLWQPEWCQGDFFMESPNPHFVFYVATGWVAALLPIEAATVVLRVAALTLFAWGWTAFFTAVTRSEWTPVWAACLFVLLQTIGSFSGEWIVGGVESKVFTYGFVFLALASALRGRWNIAAISAGLGISFHPVVGVWAVLCGTFAIALTSVKHWRTLSLKGGFRQLGTPILLLIAAALPGLIPAFWLLLIPAEDAVKFQADFIAVYYRLKHHLDPMNFPDRAYWGYAGLLGFWLLGQFYLPSTPQSKWFRNFIIATVMVAGVGFLLGWRTGPPEAMPALELRLKLLKFYPFRLFDVMLQVACVVASMRFVETWTWSRARWLVVIPITAICLAIWLPGPDKRPSRMHDKRRTNWIAMCNWIQDNTSQDAKFITPRITWAFKWFAERPEYVAFKDIPQDAEGMVEWNARLKLIRDWSETAASDDLITREETTELFEQTGAQYLIVQWLAPFEDKEEYRNRSFRIFKIEPDGTQSAEERPE